MSEDFGLPADGHWWEWRPGFGWVRRDPIEEPAEQGDESAA